MLPGYDAWNAGLIEQATYGIRRGSPIYLSIDERALLVLWRQFLGQPAKEAQAVRKAFTECVRERCTVTFLSGLHLDSLFGKDSNGRPRGVAFLAAMILAAHDMEDEDAASELNYYYRLRRVFNPNSTEHGQPDWLTNHYGERIDEQLWLEWNVWLAEHGWEPTAVHGGHNNRYINFPISQSILRNGDRDRLIRLYHDHLDSSQRSWDRELLAANLPDLAEHASSARLRNLLCDRDSDSRHFEAIGDAAFEVYAAMDWSNGDAAADSVQRLEAGLFRIQDRRGNATYSLYPRLPQRWRTQSCLQVLNDQGEPEPLTPDAHHAGRFLPLSFPLMDLKERRLPMRVDGKDEGMELVLPNRDFWILIKDPDDEYSDALATWGLPALGDPFCLLCQPQHEPQLRLLRDLELVAWENDCLDLALGSVSWKEYHACQVLRPRWDHVVPRRESKALVETLRPRAGRITISLEGGLSVPGQNIWLEGYPPLMRVRAVDRSFNWSISRRSDQSSVHPTTAGHTHELTELPNLAPGEYDIEVKMEGGATGRRVLRIAPWDGLEAMAPARGHAVEGKELHFTLRGAHLLPGEM
jgi:hypothetical protein